MARCGFKENKVCGSYASDETYTVTQAGRTSEKMHICNSHLQKLSTMPGVRVIRVEKAKAMPTPTTARVKVDPDSGNFWWND